MERLLIGSSEIPARLLIGRSERSRQGQGKTGTALLRVEVQVSGIANRPGFYIARIYSAESILVIHERRHVIRRPGGGEILFGDAAGLVEPYHDAEVFDNPVC